MKKHLLLGATALLLGGCFHLLIQTHPHEITIVMKNDIPCFGLADDAILRGEQAKIYSFVVKDEINDQFPTPAMGKFLNNITLRSGECIPYEGEAIKTNLLYSVDINITIENQRHNDRHFYGGSFCLSEKKNGEKILHHFKRKEYPESCPVSNDE